MAPGKETEKLVHRFVVWRSFGVSIVLVLGLVQVADGSALKKKPPEAELKRLLQLASRDLARRSAELKEYVCREKIAFRSWSSYGGPTWTGSEEHIFQVLEDGERREAVKVRDEARIPLTSVGGFFASVYGLLGPEYVDQYKFVLKKQNVERTVILVEVPRDISMTTLSTLDAGETRVGFKASITLATDSGAIRELALVTTQQVGRITYLKHHLRFDAVKIDGTSYNLPVAQEVLLQHRRRWFSTKHEYSDFKRFRSEVKIKF